MSMPCPLHKRYQRLYARYFLGQRTQQMLGLAGTLAGKRVADLCGGGGRLAKLALAAGAQVTLVDESAAMITYMPDGVTMVVRDVHSWLTSHCGVAEFDVMFCQQAVNYWLSPAAAQELAEVLAPGGLFVFNTFNRQPSRIPTIKQYELEGTHFVEASWLSGENTVEHVQMREGEPPHTTSFRWISREEYREWLGPWFHLEEQVDGPASVWVCRRRDAQA